MKFVKRHDTTTLLLDYAWMPIGVITADACFNSFLSPYKKNKGLDANGNPFLFDDWIAGKDVFHYEDSPALRSAHKEWFLPTVLVTGQKHLKQERSKELSKREMCAIYNFRCQCCKKKFSYRDLTLDHVEAKFLGGTNYTNNLTIMCSRCNNKKGHKPLPYYDINGKEIYGTRIPKNFLLIDDKHMREEWKKYIFYKKDKEDS